MTEKGKFLKKFNEAFAKSDIQFLLDNVTDNIKWTALGDFSVQGKKDFKNTLESMASNEPFEITIEKIITHGREAAVSGVMSSKKGERYAFCDLYIFSGFKNAKISEMNSYVIEL